MDLITKLKNEFGKDIEDLGYELVDVEFVSENGERFLRFYIYKEDGIDVTDCEKVSEFLDKKLDQLDLINKSYYLEVSSPDLSRPLKTDRDLERNKDELLEIRLINGEVFIGKIKEIGEKDLVFRLENNEERLVKKDDIKTIKIEIVF
ncbi:MAG: ribosome maturation factor RimP [Peptoniphilaceae bacterium]|nr:ribosome maturation factor RimP [Peptoniphilaceae bacterium]MDY6019069.1 ribosome maturation factor RimP [Anaerococcus sp.]